MEEESQAGEVRGFAARSALDLAWICVPAQPGGLGLASVGWGLH